MEQVEKKINNLLEKMGLKLVNLSVDEENKKISILIKDDFVKSHVSTMISSLEHLLNSILKKEGQPFFVVDINNYRKERERLISDLAKAAAHRALITKSEVKLPPMNAYERRIVHLEVATHPILKTESEGESRERYVVIRHIED